MKKILRILICVICLSMLVGCGMEKLSDKYNEDELRSASENIIKLLNEGKYDEIVASGGITLQKDGAEEQIKKGHESVTKKIGDFQGVENISYQEKNGYAVVVPIVKYENRKIQYIFSYDEELKLVELFMK